MTNNSFKAHKKQTIAGDWMKRLRKNYLEI